MCAYFVGRETPHWLRLECGIFHFIKTFICTKCNLLNLFLHFECAYENTLHYRSILYLVSVFNNNNCAPSPHPRNVGSFLLLFFVFIKMKFSNKKKLARKILPQTIK